MPEPYPSTPVQVPCVYADYAVRYTDVAQLEWFQDTINWWYAQNSNVRIDEDDPEGLRIRWYHAYTLPFGHFLYVSTSRSEMYSCTEWQLRTYLRPQPDWPAELSPVFGYPDDFVPPEGA